MTVDEMKARLVEIEKEERRLSDERYRLHLAIEVEEGRPDSHRARFARAAIANDSRAMAWLCAENAANHYRETGKWSEHQEQAEQIIAGAHAAGRRAGVEEAS